MWDDELSSSDMRRLDALFDKAKDYYLDKGYPPRAADEAAARALYEKTGYTVSTEWREDYSPRDRTQRAGRTGGGHHSEYGSGGGRARAGRRDSWTDLYEEKFGRLSSEHPDARSHGSSRRYEDAAERYYIPGSRFDSARGAERPSARAQSKAAAGTEYDRMFQNGGDRYASRTSGKILSPEEIKKQYQQIVLGLVTQGWNREYARQQGEKFLIREMGKRTAAGLEKSGYPKDYNIGEAEEEMRDRWGGRGQSSRGFDGYDSSRGQSRAEYGGYGTRPEERYNFNHNYTDAQLRSIAEEIYDEWLEKGADREEARHEARKWFSRAKASGSSSRGSGFDSFDGMRESLDDKDEYGRGSRSSRGSRADDSRYSSRGNGRGYRTQEFRPSEFSSGNYNGYDDRSGWHDRNDMPSGVKPDKDLYQLLGVSKQATVAEIKAARRKLCIKYHPDRVQGGQTAKDEATEKMAQINQACDVLMDGEMRAFYDRTGLIASVGESPDA